MGGEADYCSVCQRQNYSKN